nr:hypothetical protein [Tanacetum cinerariifolium]
MALWKSQVEDHTFDWLRVVLISGLGQTVSIQTYQCVLCDRLGVPLFFVLKPCSACFRFFARDIYRDHVVVCAGMIDCVPGHVVIKAAQCIRVKYEAKLQILDMVFSSSILFFRELEKDTMTFLKILAGKEVDIGLGGGCDKPLCPVDMLLYLWNEGLDVCIDLTGLHLRRRRDAVTLLKHIRKYSVTQYIGARDVVHTFNRISFAIAKRVGSASILAPY